MQKVPGGNILPSIVNLDICKRGFIYLFQIAKNSALE